MSPENIFSVMRNMDLNRFEIQVNSLIAELDFIMKGDTILFTSTSVPTQLEGRGIGSALVKAGLEYAIANKLKVQTTCWFVRGYIQRHPELKIDENE